MNKKYSDEKLDTMLAKIMNAEVPEEIQFREHLNGEIKASVKQAGTFTGRKYAGIAAICAACICIIMLPFYMLNTGETNNSDDKLQTDNFSSAELDEQISLFNEAQERYSFAEIPLESSDFYRAFAENPYIENYNTPETGILLSLGLIPYEITETEGRKLFVRVLKSGNRVVFTRQAYLAGYDESGSINYLLGSEEVISDDEESIIIHSDIFAGAENAESGFGKIVSKFSNRNSELKIDGITVRDKLESSTEHELKTGSLYACVKTGNSVIPLSIYELEYTVSDRLPENPELPDFIKVTEEKDKTKIYTVIMYDCTNPNSFRTEPEFIESIWTAE